MATNPNPLGACDPLLNHPAPYGNLLPTQHQTGSFTEDSPPGGDYLAGVCAQWEAAAQKVTGVGSQAVGRGDAGLCWFGRGICTAFVRQKGNGSLTPTKLPPSACMWPWVRSCPHAPLLPPPQAPVRGGGYDMMMQRHYSSHQEASKCASPSKLMLCLPFQRPPRTQILAPRPLVLLDCHFAFPPPPGSPKHARRDRAYRPCTGTGRRCADEDAAGV